jgi:hypothetical protein
MGKMGRAETALDPAPLGMIETVVLLKPYANGRCTRSRKKTARTEHRPRTLAKCAPPWPRHQDIPGVAPSWLQPIETRVVMLSTGIRSLLALQILGDDTDALERFAERRRRSSRDARRGGRADAARGRQALRGNPARSRRELARFGLSQRAGHAHGRDRVGRHGHHLFGRRRAALSGAHPLPARAARRSRRTANWCRCRPRRGDTARSRWPTCSRFRPCTRWSFAAGPRMRINSSRPALGGPAQLHDPRSPPRGADGGRGRSRARGRAGSGQVRGRSVRPKPA